MSWQLPASSLRGGFYANLQSAHKAAKGSQQQPFLISFVAPFTRHKHTRAQINTRTPAHIHALTCCCCCRWYRYLFAKSNFMALLLSTRRHRRRRRRRHRHLRRLRQWQQQAWPQVWLATYPQSTFRLVSSHTACRRCRCRCCSCSTRSC